MFQRREQREQSRFYQEGLLSDERRKSVERMVLHQRGADRNAVRTAQMFVGQGRWADAPLQQRHGSEVAQTLGDAAGVLIVDGSEIRKQGRESVGVARQNCGELGQKANCQAGVFLAYASAAGATLVHRELYLPRPWVEAVDKGIPQNSAVKQQTARRFVYRLGRCRADPAQGDVGGRVGR